MVDRLWAIVLAGGEGIRLRDLARDEHGEPAPKQYCNFGGECTLLASALARAERLVPGERVVVSVLEPHRRWWDSALAGRPAGAAVSQPCSRGTAAGVLAPLLRILRADPGARVVILPSDHAVEDEAILGRSLDQAARIAERRPEDLVLLGFTPDTPDPALGWIVPSPEREGDGQRVVAFEEKPDPGRARRLMAEGGMWNGLLMAATAAALIGLYERFLPELIPAVAEIVRPHRAGSGAKPGASYAMLPFRDLSRDLLTPAVAHLRVVPVPGCGWSDLGTPARLLRWQASHGCLHAPIARSA